MRKIELFNKEKIVNVFHQVYIYYLTIIIIVTIENELNMEA